MIERLINILRNAGFEDLTAVEVAEMILLADFLPAPIQPVADPQTPDITEPVVETPTSPESENDPPQAEPPHGATTETSDPPAVNLHDKTSIETEGEGVDVVPFRTPRANALPGAQKIARALRPLRRRYPSARRFVLDEERTVRRIADCGLFSPVLRPAPENWLEAALIFDESVSMRVWGETLDQLERLFERCGYFRDVRSWRLNTESAEAKLFREAAGQSRLERRPGELLDPARRRLIIVVSDCLGPAWRSGTAFRFVHGWAASGPVALVQTLPRCFWAGTTMTPVDAVLRAPKPGASNRLLQIAPSWYGEIAEAGGVAMPILTLDEWSIAPWAQSVAGAGGVVVSGLMIPPPEAMLAEDSASPNGLEGNPGSHSAVERIDSFFRAATHEAKRLACYLASAPLSLPVMRLVQQTMLPGSRQTHLAEVFLSGLLYQTTTHREQDEILYEFYDGVREELRRRVTESETERVIYQVSRFIESRIGESGDFEAWLGVPAVGGAVRRLDPLSRRFASLSAEILKRSGRRRELVERLERLVGTAPQEANAPVLENEVQLPIETATERPRIYCSHSMDDRKQVDDLYRRLVDENFAPWIDRYEISSALEWEDKALTALRKSEFFLCLISQTTTRRSSGFYRQELRTALDLCAGARRNDRFLIPVRLEECELPAEIADRQAINLYESDGFDRLLEALRAEMDRRRQAHEQQESLSLLERCLRDELDDEAAAQLARRIGEMSAVEAIGEMREAGIGLRTDMLSVIRDNSLILHPTNQHGQAIYAFLLEANRRGRVLKSIPQLKAMIPPHIGGVSLRQEVEKIKQDIQLFLDRGRSDRLMRATGGQRSAAILAATEMQDRFPGGVMVVDLENRAIDSSGVMEECVAPFLHLNTGMATSPLLLLMQFESIFERGEFLIILDKVGDFREMSKLSLRAGSFIIAIDGVLDPLPNRSAVEGRLREARGNYDRLSRQLEAIRQERDLVKMPAPQLRTNLEIQRRTFLQNIRECESQLRGLERDPVMGLAELIMQFSSRDDRPLPLFDDMIAELRNAPSEEAEAVILQNIGEEFGRIRDYQTASQFCEFALDREPRDLRLHIETFERLGQFEASISRYEPAIEWLEKALENAETLNDDPGQLRLRGALSEIRGRQRRPALDPTPQPQSFSFQTITLDESGRELTRNTLTALQIIEDLGEGVQLEMVEIPGGSFLMGSTESEEEDYEDERPQHETTIKPFLIGKFPVTQRQWRVVARWDRVERDLDLYPSDFKTQQDSDDRPVERVPWDDAKEFCARLSRQTGKQYRLPSEAEWEYACRARTSTPYAFGPALTRGTANFNAEGPFLKGGRRAGEGETIPVGSLGVANAFGLYDMHGNVLEWCEDVWHDTYNGAPIDGSAWFRGGDDIRRVLRGGSWNYGMSYCRSASRLHMRYAVRMNFIGFRVLLEPSTTQMTAS
jgi:formylglycine-generating enzyme required for sulfatase activity